MPLCSGEKAEAKNAGKVTTQMVNTFYIGEIQQKSFGYSENFRNVIVLLTSRVYSR